MSAGAWRRGLVSLLGAFQLLLAAGASSAAITTLGIVGGLVLGLAPWLGVGRLPRLVLAALGAVPFAALTWSTVVSPVLALIALVLVASTAGPGVLRSKRRGRSPGAPVVRSSTLVDLQRETP